MEKSTVDMTDKAADIVGMAAVEDTADMDFVGFAGNAVEHIEEDIVEDKADTVEDTDSEEHSSLEVEEELEEVDH